MNSTHTLTDRHPSTPRELGARQAHGDVAGCARCRESVTGQCGHHAATRAHRIGR